MMVTMIMTTMLMMMMIFINFHFITSQLAANQMRPKGGYGCDHGVWLEWGHLATSNASLVRN